MQRKKICKKCEFIGVSNVDFPQRRLLCNKCYSEAEHERYLKKKQKKQIKQNNQVGLINYPK